MKKTKPRMTYCYNCNETALRNARGCGWCSRSRPGWMPEDWPQWPRSPHESTKPSHLSAKEKRLWVYASADYNKDSAWVEVDGKGRPIQEPMPEHFTPYEGRVWTGFRFGWVLVDAEGRAAHSCMASIADWCEGAVTARSESGWRPICGSCEKRHAEMAAQVPAAEESEEADESEPDFVEDDDFMMPDW